MLTQPDYLRTFLAARDGDARASGLAARCLIWEFDFRPVGLGAADHYADTILSEYGADIEYYLDLDDARLLTGVGRTDVVLSAKCEGLWRDIDVWRTRTIARRPELTDVICRLTQSVLRIAAIIELFRPFRDTDSRVASVDDSAARPRPDASVMPDALQAAWAIGRFQYSAFEKLYPPQVPVWEPTPKWKANQRFEQRVQEDSARIMDVFDKCVARSGKAEVAKRAVQDRSGLYGARFRPALAHLLDIEALAEEGSGRTSKLRLGRMMYSRPVFTIGNPV